MVHDLFDFEQLEKTHKLVVWHINKCYTYKDIFNLSDGIGQYDELHEQSISENCKHDNKCQKEANHC